LRSPGSTDTADDTALTGDAAADDTPA